MNPVVLIAIGVAALYLLRNKQVAATTVQQCNNVTPKTPPPTIAQPTETAPPPLAHPGPAPLPGPRIPVPIPTHTPPTPLCQALIKSVIACNKASAATCVNQIVAAATAHNNTGRLDTIQCQTQCFQAEAEAHGVEFGTMVTECWNGERQIITGGAQG